MKKLALALSIFVAGTVAASAADMAPRTYTKAPPPLLAYDWSGVYVGVNAGYAWADFDPSTTATCGTNPPFYFNCNNQSVVQAAGSRSKSADGFTGGFQAGYNWQSGQMVFGGEVDVEALRLRASQTVPSGYAGLAAGRPFAVSTADQTDWLSTFRGRLGWTVSPGFLIYGTGGLALTNFKTANSYADFFGASSAATASEVKAGWTAGGGAEWQVARNWSVKAEYLYVDFGRVSVSSIVTEPVGSPGSSSTLATSTRLTTQLGRIGLNYKF